jgi:hypothetical protein
MDCSFLAATGIYSVTKLGSQFQEGGGGGWRGEYVFVSILARENKIKVIRHQRKRIKSTQYPITSQRQTNARSNPTQRIRQTSPLSPCNEDDIPNTLSSEVPPHQTSGEYKREEIPIIPTSHTVVEPYTMVIAVFYATIAYSTMGRARRSPYSTCRAVFGRYVVGVLEVFLGGYDGEVTGRGKEMPSLSRLGL